MAVLAYVVIEGGDGELANKGSSAPKAVMETADTYWITQEDSSYMCAHNRTEAGFNTASMTLPSGLVIHYKYEQERDSSGRIVYSKSPVKQTKIIDKR